MRLSPEGEAPVEDGSLIGLVITLVVVATVVPSLYFVFRLLKGLHANAAEEARLMQFGAPAQGVIVAAQQTGTYVNNNPQVQFLVQVTPHGGAPYQTQLVKIVPMFEMAQYQVGTQVGVRFDPQNPMKIAIIPAMHGMMPGQMPGQGWQQGGRGY